MNNKKMLIMGDLLLDQNILVQSKNIKSDSDELYIIKEFKSNFGGVGRIVDLLLFEFKYSKFDFLTIIDDSRYINEMVDNIYGEMIDTKYIYKSEKWCTPRKNRFYVLNNCDKNHRSIRMDYEILNNNENTVISSIINQFKYNNDYDFVLLCDYGKGMITDSVLDLVLQYKDKYQFKLFVDSKMRKHFRDIDIIKMNISEYIKYWDNSITGYDTNEIGLSLIRLSKKRNIPIIIVTCDQLGAIYSFGNNYYRIETIIGAKEHYIGSGDYFSASFIYEYFIKDLPLHESIERSCKLASVYEGVCYECE